MNKPVLAILTDSIRYDNHIALKHFKNIEIKHFYNNAPYGDLTKEQLSSAVKWDTFEELEQKLLELKPDIIQGAEPYASRRALKLCLLTMKVTRRLNVPYIFPVLENRPVKARFGFLAGIFLKKIMAKYAKNAALIFYLNNGAKRNLLEVGTDPKKLKREMYGIWGADINLFKPISKSVFDKKNDFILGKI